MSRRVWCVPNRNALQESNTRQRNGRNGANGLEPRGVEQAKPTTGWFQRAGGWLMSQNLLQRAKDFLDDDDLSDGDPDELEELEELEDAAPLTHPARGIGSALNALDWDHVRAEVEREARARVIVVGARGAGKSTLLAQLIGASTETVSFDGTASDEGEAPTDELQNPTLENFGFFGVIDLPDGYAAPHGAGSFGNETNALMAELANADLIVWVLDGAAGLRNWEYAWLGRVRAMSKPLLVAVNKVELIAERAMLEQWERALGCGLVEISARDSKTLKTKLLPRIAQVTPNLATALGREVTLWRSEAAKRVTERAATLSGVMGLEPVPLLDVPFQILIQLQMVMRIAAIYGQPMNDRFSREMLATMVSAVGMRAAGQQAVKIVPVVGWVVSGALAAGGTLALGRIAIDYFENGRRVRIPRLRRSEGESR